jgi:hypothetical protein
MWPIIRWLWFIYRSVIQAAQRAEWQSELRDHHISSPHH